MTNNEHATGRRGVDHSPLAFPDERRYKGVLPPDVISQFIGAAEQHIAVGELGQVFIELAKLPDVHLAASIALKLGETTMSHAVLDKAGQLDPSDEVQTKIQEIRASVSSGEPATDDQDGKKEVNEQLSPDTEEGSIIVLDIYPSAETSALPVPDFEMLGELMALRELVVSGETRSIQIDAMRKHDRMLLKALDAAASAGDLALAKRLAQTAFTEAGEIDTQEIIDFYTT